MIDLSDLAPSEICALGSPFFTSLRAPLFRRATGDGMPVLVLQLGEREATLPLDALQRELGIPYDSPDGRMLGLITAALDYVTELRPGDPLPAEVLTGEASWQPDPEHLRIAATRLRGQFAIWLRKAGTAGPCQIDAEDLELAEHDPVLRHEVLDGFAHAATALGLPSTQDVVGLLESIARELAYIEALRERLLHPLRNMARRFDAVGSGWRGDSTHMEMLILVRRLTSTALSQVNGCFVAVDAQSADVLTALGNVAATRAVIRANRDWLYRSQRAFAPILTEWQAAPRQLDDQFWSLLGRSYRFLAPRFMGFKEWHLPQRRGADRRKPRAQMAW